MMFLESLCWLLGTVASIWGLAEVAWSFWRASNHRSFVIAAHARPRDVDNGPLGMMRVRLLTRQSGWLFALGSAWACLALLRQGALPPVGAIALSLVNGAVLASLVPLLQRGVRPPKMPTRPAAAKRRRRAAGAQTRSTPRKAG